MSILHEETVLLLDNCLLGVGVIMIALLAGAVLQGQGVSRKDVALSHTIISEFIDRHPHKRVQEDRMGINDENPKNYPRWNGHMGPLGVTKRIQQHKGKENLTSASSVIKPL
ncbi:hypothetical protein M438DRAFT_390706 [Aureobasidium pullulans EXF-150]|uniref:Uncharacterized protein n=1 Tax=Aureobasidium pullulans EXF-150 TaxID=1043002 RepID=A0A074YFS5_AURPU|nr:uncharacterized protein M438DRAFT_390706 [Aureobasidium pullulans EXF-150]KEQ85701.1 hypothetical protein M438DRAFT_390706 [Aureobasidium pullulans EXF-150]